MSEYEELREKLILIAMKAHRQPAEDTADEILSIIADKCWLKDKEQESTCADVKPWYWDDGWRPVKEIKKDG